ncbi:hypothetical protein L218DRAFT_957428 [Marasmius fiardii PR-910]|nr:hypothetical protein L218DRAFT_957428 [Marasmius fiardii PR-910]
MNIQSSHILSVLKIKNDYSEAELGVFRGHMTRGNSQCKATINHLESIADAEDEPPRLKSDVLVIDRVY